MLPGDKIHQVAKAAQHPVAARRNLLRPLVHQVVGVPAGPGRLFHLLLAEAIPEPAHNQARLEGKRLILPQIGDCVAVDPHPAAGVCFAAAGVKLILPKAAAEHHRLSCLAGPDADGAQLAVAAAHHHRGALLQARFGCALGADRGKIDAAFHHRREDIGAQAALGRNLRVPVPALQIHHAGGAAIAGLHRQLAGELIDEPIVEHANGRGFAIDIGQIILYPQQPGQRPQGVGLAASGVDLLLQVRVKGDELADLGVAAGVHVGTGPNFIALFVIKQNSFAHTCSGYSGDFLRGDAGFFQHPFDTGFGQVPVGDPVKVHASRPARVFFVGPFPLDTSYLGAIHPEDYRADAAGSGIYCHEILRHLCCLLQKNFRSRAIRQGIQIGPQRYLRRRLVQLLSFVPKGPVLFLHR